MMKKWTYKLMIGALALSVLAPAASFAAANATISESKTAQSQGFHRGMFKMTVEQKQENQAQLMEWINKYTPELVDQFQAIFDQKEKSLAAINEIREQVKAGTMTEEEAQTKLKELGVNFRGKGIRHQPLDEETKAKVDAIREQVKAGTMTEEEAQTKLKEMGVNFRGKGIRHQPLDEETKAKVDAIREQVKAGTLTEEEAKTKLKEWGVNFRGKGMGPQPLDEETKAKVDAIREQVKAGTLTEEEGKTKLKELGIDFFKNKGSNHYDELRQAVENNDEAKIKELLTQLLSHLKNHGQE